MPQMSPLNWLSLYILFSLIFLMLIIFNYYMFIYTPKFFSIKNKKLNINWKW
uniref:ATP synthase complex subunit 8 n=1 Tax=Curculionoidea sp. 17 KM-2017 TaxID=2219400 RepID=A0A346RGP5_9CUCU|nr:ATP synthase F0 subunit 8 [Curculionoidea sp. 17 KM-2017]